jgi:hypothetical protein
MTVGGRTRKTVRASAAIVVVMAGAGLGALGAGRAHGAAPNSLQVYNAQSIATPLGIVLRVPAESDGGVDYAETDLDLTKARAAAGGFTAGALGDAFLQTSLPNYTNPTLVVAENPPTAVFPTEASAPLGAATPAGRAANFHAVATATPSATADAEGGTLDVSNLVHIGGAVSRTVSQIEADGTVATRATSSVENLTLGPTLIPLVSVAHMTSTAEVRVPPGQAPQTSFKMTIAGALIGGVPVQITDQGVSVGGGLAVPPSGVAAVNQALARLQALGLTVATVPVTKDGTGIGATIQGAALQLRTQAPASLALPTDIGKDNTFLLGEVRASALARQRQPLALPGGSLDSTPPSGPDLTGPTQDVSAAGTASAPSPLTSGTALASPATASLPQTGSTSLGGFNFAARARHTPASAFLAGYRVILLAALAGLGAFLVRQRTRLTE